VLVQVEKSGKVTPVHITSERLNYADPTGKSFSMEGSRPSRPTRP